MTLSTLNVIHCLLHAIPVFLHLMHVSLHLLHLLVHAMPHVLILNGMHIILQLTDMTPYSMKMAPHVMH
jgi:hypothetical protein